MSVQGTGHGLLCDLADTVLVSTRRMNAVCVDPQTDTARARAGVR